MKLISSFKPLCGVTLPFRGRQKYMHTFDTNTFEMAEGFEDYLPIVGALCDSASYSGIAYMTVDEKVVEAGMSQRRPGPHVDGRFMPDKGRWGGGNWLHYCNNVPFSRMALIIASDVPGCIAYPGEFTGQPTEDGDLAHIQDQLPQGVLLDGGMAYWLSPDCVHESMRFSVPTRRTFLRIALDI